MSRYFTFTLSPRIIGQDMERLPGVLALRLRVLADRSPLRQPLQNSYDDGVASAARDLRDGSVWIGPTGGKLDADGHRGMDAPVSVKEGPPGCVRNGVDDDVGTGGQGTRLAVQGRTV